MKRIMFILILLCLLFVPGCSSNPKTNNYDNTNEKNIEEDVYEDDMGDAETLEGAVIYNWSL